MNQQTNYFQLIHVNVVTGWDLKKNLLLIDEWRICNPKFAKATSDTIPKAKGHSALDLINFGKDPKTVDEKYIETCTIEPDSKASNDSIGVSNVQNVENTDPRETALDMIRRDMAGRQPTNFNKAA